MEQYLPRPSLAPLACLVGALVSLVFGGISAQWSQDTQIARQRYSAALADTRSLLAAQVHDLAADPLLQQNLSANLGNSLQGNLSAALVHGQLEQLVLYDSRCQELSRAALGKVASIPCQEAQGGDGFYWSTGAEAAGTPVLGFARQLQVASIGAVTLVGQLALSHDWLLLHPGLAQSFRELRLRLGPVAEEPQGRGRLLAEEGSRHAGGAVAGLWTDHWALRQGLPLLENPQLFQYGFFWPLILAACALWLSQALTQQRARRRLPALAAQLRSQVQSLLAFPSLRFHYDAAADQRFAGIEPFAGVLSDLVAGLQAQTTHAEAMQKALEREQTAALKWQKRCQQLQAQSAHQAEHDALALHIKQAAMPFMQRLKKQASAQHHLGQVVEHGLRQDGKLMAGLIDLWRLGLQEKGARKFVRSLSETLSEQATPEAGPERSEPVTRLEEELGQLLEVALRLSDQALHVARLVRGFEAEHEQAMRVLAFWYGLALRDEQGGNGEVPSNLRPLLTQAEELRQQQEGAGRLNLSVHEEAPLPIPAKVPLAVLVAAFCHILTALAGVPPEGDAAATPLVVLKSKRLGDDELLLFTLAQGELPPEDPRCREPWRHAELANRLLSPYGVSFQALPAQRQFSSFAVMWKGVVRAAGVPLTAATPASQEQPTR